LLERANRPQIERYWRGYQLVAMNGGAVQLLYDGDGNRVAKSVNGVVTRYLVDDLNPTGYPQVVDELTSGVVTRTYSYGLQRVSEDQVISNTWTPSFYSYDGMGNVRALTNTAGATTDSDDHDRHVPAGKLFRADRSRQRRRTDCVHRAR
jgi:hypothetical protein